MSDGDETQNSRRKDQFPRTDKFPRTWLDDLDRANGDDTVASAAQGRIYELYRYPLYAFTRRYGKSVEDAEDIVQSFFQKLFAGHALKNYDPQKGRLRSYMLGALKYHIGTWNRKEARQVRTVSMDVETAEKWLNLEPDNASPDRVYERRCGISVIAESQVLLKQSYVDEGKEELFDLLFPFMDERPSRETRMEVEGRLNKSPNAIRMDVCRMRKRRHYILRSIFARTTPLEDVDDEIAYLIGLFTNH